MNDVRYAIRQVAKSPGFVAGVKPGNPIVLASVSIVLAAVALLAS